MKKDRILETFGFFHAWLLAWGAFLLGQSLVERLTLEELFLLTEKGLVLWVPVLGLFFAKERGKRIWSYLLVWAFCAFLVWNIGTSSWEKGWLLGICAFLALFYLKARLEGIPGFLEKPAYSGFFVFGIAFLYGSFFDREPLARLMVYASGIYWLLLLWRQNRENFLKVCQENEGLYRFDRKRLAFTSSILLGAASLLAVFAMLVFPALGLERVLREVGRALRRFLSLIFSGEREEPIEDFGGEAVNPGEFSFGEPGGEPSPFWDLLSRIFITGFQILLVLGAVVLTCRGLYLLYARYSRTLGKNGDIQEDLRGGAKEQREREGKRRKFGFTLFLSWNDQVRKIYKKSLLKKKKPRLSASPWELEEEAGFSDCKERREFHRLYEEARYGKDPLRKEEVRKMKELDRVDFSDKIV